MRKGFSLVELSVVLVIIGLLAAGGMTIGRAFITNTEYRVTQDKLKEIAESLEFFYKIHGRLPCPAQNTLGVDDAEFGREILWVYKTTSCANSTTVPTGTTRFETSTGSGIWVRSGALPVRDMKLSDQMIYDDFSQHFTYVVMEGLTSNSTFATTSGALVIADGRGATITSNAIYVVLSHGYDAKGAVLKTGVTEACGASTNKDVENCDGDATFHDTVFSRGDEADFFFDDLIIWMTKDIFNIKVAE